MMKKIMLTVFTVSTLFGSSCVLADNHTVSLGYSQAEVKDFKNIQGMNAQYRYEWDSPISVIGSLTYMTGDKSHSLGKNIIGYNGKTELKYYSLVAGPAYRINDYVSLYAVAGVAFTKAKDKVTYLTQYSEYSEDKTSFAYGAGIEVNPVENISVSVGYEGTQVKYNNNVSINGFNVAVGYRF